MKRIHAENRPRLHAGAVVVVYFRVLTRAYNGR
jgi:hypothetical protein